MFKTEQNKRVCINCCLKYFFRYHSFIGHFPFKRKCTHDGYLTSTYEMSPILVAISYVISILLFATTCYEFCCGFNTEISVWEVENITALGFLIFGVCNSLTIMLTNSNRGLLMTIIDVFSTLANSDVIFVKGEEKQAKFSQLRRRSAIYISIASLSAILGGLLPYFTTKRFVSLIAALKIYSFCSGCYTTTVPIDGITLISEILFLGLTRTLDAKLRGGRTDIYNDLKKLTKRRCTMQKIMQKMSRYATPTVTIFYPLMLLFSFSAVYVAIIEVIRMATSQEYSVCYILWPFILFHLHYASQSNTTLLEMVCLEDQ